MLRLTATIALVLALTSNALAVGAMAIDDEAGLREVGFGFVTGYADKDAAIAAAVAECKRHGNRDCDITFWFKKCGAYAVSSNYFGTGWGDTAKDAERMAHEKCGKNCRIVISECE